MNDGELRLPWETLEALGAGGIEDACRGAVRDAVRAALRRSDERVAKSRARASASLGDAWRPGQSRAA
mgnify:CR=1 FL=1